MKIEDLNYVTNRNFKPFYKIPTGFTFQLYTMLSSSVHGGDEYYSSFLTKQDEYGGCFNGFKLGDGGFCTIGPTDLVKQITYEDSSTNRS